MRFRRWVGWWTVAVLLAFGGVAASYTNTWDETAPAGSALASTIDDHIRQLKLDMRERLAASAAAWNTGNITLAPTAVTSPALTITGGTYTTDINALSVTETWNAAGVTFTGLKWNTTSTASAADSLLFDFQVGGSSKGKLDKDGDATIAGGITVEATAGRVPSVIDRDVTTIDVVNTVTETTVYSFSVPGGTLGTNRALRLTLIADYLNNTAGAVDFTLKVTYGATTILATGAGFSVNQGTTRRAVKVGLTLSALNATNTQVSVGEFGIAPLNTATGGLTSGSTGKYVAVHNAIAEDSTAAKTLAITFTHGTAAANISARAHVVQLELL